MGKSGQQKSITVTVKYLSVLRDKAGTPQESVELPPGSRLETMARWLEERHGFKYGDGALMFTLNGRGWSQYGDGLETELGDGDTVMLFMPVSGG